MKGNQTETASGLVIPLFKSTGKSDKNQQPIVFQWIAGSLMRYVELEFKGFIGIQWIPFLFLKVFSSLL